MPLGTNATFFCSGMGSTTNWIINNTVVGFGNEATFIERGFVFQKERVHTSDDETQNINDLTMTVLATIENNNTMIKCLSTGDGPPVVSDVVNFTVIGKLNISIMSIHISNIILLLSLKAHDTSVYNMITIIHTKHTVCIKASVHTSVSVYNVLFPLWVPFP